MTNELRRLLLFSAGGQRFAIRLSEVAEVVEPVPLNSVPRAPAFIVGAINFHGTVVPVVDLAHFLGATPLKGEGKFVVLDQRHVQLALVVDPTVDVVAEQMVFPEEPTDGDQVPVAVDGESRLLDLEQLVMQ
ncbi:MAG TPA: chemotaxis protein CheW, partial [Geobacterales bacterium]|nr:chemotaxis protein CheW [Geobacterales bacterium]